MLSVMFPTWLKAVAVYENNIIRMLRLRQQSEPGKILKLEKISNIEILVPNAIAA